VHPGLAIWLPTTDSATYSGIDDLRERSKMCSCNYSNHFTVALDQTCTKCA